MLDKNKLYHIYEILEEADLPVFIHMASWTPDFFVLIDRKEEASASGYGYNMNGLMYKRYDYPLHYWAYYYKPDDVEKEIKLYKEEIKKENYLHWQETYSLTELAPCSFRYYHGEGMPDYTPGKTILTVQRNGENVDAVFTGFGKKNGHLLVYTYYAQTNKFCLRKKAKLKYQDGTGAPEKEIRDLIKELECCTENRDIILQYFRDFRNIKYLVHFTPVDNLNSIFQNGILPRCTLEKESNAIYTDVIRYDNCKECSCFSLSFPNYQMLYLKRQIVNAKEFAVLLIDINALVSTDINHVYYLPVNASSKEFGNYVREFRHLKDAQNMFTDHLTYKEKDYSREELNIPEYYPTSPQAEILIDGIISPSYIKEIHFPQNYLSVKKGFPLKNIPTHISYKISDELFRPRTDNDFWAKEEIEDGDQAGF